MPLRRDLAPLTGVLFVALLVAGVAVIGNFEFLQDPDELAAFYVTKNSQIFIGGGIALGSAFFLVWFAGSMRTYLRSAERGDGRLSAIAFGGGLVAASAVTIAYSARYAAAERATAASGISPDVATALDDFASLTLGSAFAVGLAIMFAATSVVSFRTGVFPRWVVWIGAILTVALLSQSSAAAVILPGALAWVAVLSIVMYVKQPPGES
jgi:hypothetical protein